MQDVIGSAEADRAEAERALAHIFATPAFERSDRMRAFLSYVVAEAVAGRGDRIRAKTIAQDVYGRDPFCEDYSENVVRVDNFYFDEQVTDELLTLLEKAGWSPS